MVFYRKLKNQEVMKKKKLEMEKQLNGHKNDINGTIGSKADSKTKNSKKSSIRKVKKIDTNVKRKFLKKVEGTSAKKTAD
jgi:hypothetical protein